MNLFKTVTIYLRKAAMASITLLSSQLHVSSPLDAAEGVLVSLFGLDFKVEGPSGGGASSKVDAGDLLEAQVYRRLVDIDEASL